MSDRVKRLSAEDWERAALDAIAAHGLHAVAVEPLARKLGVTKGSFYAHFRDRDQLLGAALRRWENAQVDGFLASPEPPDPAARLEQLLTTALKEARSGTVLGRLLLETDDARVRAAIRRVTKVRLERLTAAIAELGHPQDTASQRALIAYAIYIGMLQLAREVPKQVTNEPLLRDELRRAIGLPIEAQ